MATDNIFAFFWTVCILVVMASSFKGSKPIKTIKKFTTVAFDIVLDHIQLLVASNKRYNSLGDYLDEFIPIMCIELKKVINKSNDVDNKIKQLITDEMIRDFMISIVSLYEEELNLALDYLNEEE